MSCKRSRSINGDVVTTTGIFNEVAIEDVVPGTVPPAPSTGVRLYSEGGELKVINSDGEIEALHTAEAFGMQTVYEEDPTINVVDGVPLTVTGAITGPSLITDRLNIEKTNSGRGPELTFKVTDTGVGAGAQSHVRFLDKDDVLHAELKTVQGGDLTIFGSQQISLVSGGNPPIDVQTIPANTEAINQLSQDVADSVQSLQDDIANEAKTREDADTQIQTAISNEVTALQLADGQLQLALDNSVATLEQADLVLTQAISDETTARVTADGLKVDKAGDSMSGALLLPEIRDLSGNTFVGLANNTIAIGSPSVQFSGSLIVGNNPIVSTFVPTLDTHVTNKAYVDSYVGNSTDAETAARIAADNVLQANIDDEESDRIAADGFLQTNINNEIQARVAADDVLEDRTQNQTAIVGETTFVGDVQCGTVVTSSITNPTGALSIDLTPGAGGPYIDDFTSGTLLNGGQFISNFANAPVLESGRVKLTEQTLIDQYNFLDYPGSFVNGATEWYISGTFRIEDNAGADGQGIGVYFSENIPNGSGGFASVNVAIIIRTFAGGTVDIWFNNVRISNQVPSPWIFDITPNISFPFEVRVIHNGTTNSTYRVTLAGNVYNYVHATYTGGLSINHVGVVAYTTSSSSFACNYFLEDVELDTVPSFGANDTITLTSQAVYIPGTITNPQVQDLENDTQNMSAVAGTTNFNGAITIQTGGSATIREDDNELQLQATNGIRISDGPLVIDNGSNTVSLSYTGNTNTTLDLNSLVAGAAYAEFQISTTNGPGNVIFTSGEYNNVERPCTISLNNDFTYLADATLRYDGTTTRIFRVNADVCLRDDGNAEWAVAFFKNDTREGDSMLFDLVKNKLLPVTHTRLISIAPNDTIQLRAFHSTGSDRTLFVARHSIQITSV